MDTFFKGLVVAGALGPLGTVSYALATLHGAVHRDVPEQPLTLIPSTHAFKREKLNNPNTSSKIYPVRGNSCKNLALLITNVEFDLPGMKRKGAEKDEKNMTMLLTALGYEVEKHINLSGKEMDSAVERFSKDPCLRHADSVFVVIGSHGSLGEICGVHWRPDNNDVFKIDKLYAHLNTENCPALLNKPKVFIIQACRGGEDGGTTVGAIASDAHRDTEGIRAHKEKDFISLLSCTPNTVSYRNTVTGSFLFQYIVEIFNKYAHEEHIEDLFMKVISKFEEDTVGGIQMAAKDRCTLTKHLYLFPGL